MKKTRLKYLIFGGYVLDEMGREKYVSAGETLRAYGINPAECKLCELNKPETYSGYPAGIVRLFPRSSRKGYQSVLKNLGKTESRKRDLIG